MIKRLNSFFEYFIPAVHFDDPRIYRKSFFTVVWLVIAGLTCLAYGAFYVLIGFREGVIADLIGVVMSVILVAHFRKTGNFSVIVWLYTLTCTVVVWILSNYNGGAYSPATVYYGLNIITAFWVGNFRLGLIITSLTLVGMAVLVPISEWILGPPINTFPQGYDDVFILTVNTTILLCFALSTILYEFTRIELEKKLDESQTQLIKSEKMASLGQLTAGVAHEINNPLNFIGSSAEALQLDVEEILALHQELALQSTDDRYPPALNALIKKAQSEELEVTVAETRKLLSAIHYGNDRISEIVKGLKLFSRQSDETFNKENINDLLRAALIILSNKIKDKEAEVKLDLRELPPVNCQGGKINQVFVNIIDNAIDAISKGGQISIQSCRNGETVKVTIQDNGKGMNEATLQKVFDPFFTTKELGQGTGLGMAISYGILQEHSGEIAVNSQENTGTEVVLSLPLQV